jgi:hypothetical protein
VKPESQVLFQQDRRPQRLRVGYLNIPEVKLRPITGKTYLPSGAQTQNTSFAVPMIGTSVVPSVDITKMSCGNWGGWFRL